MKSKKTKPKLAISATSTVCSRVCHQRNWLELVSCKFAMSHFTFQTSATWRFQLDNFRVQITLHSPKSTFPKEPVTHLDQLGLRHFHGYAPGPIQGSVQPQPHLCQITKNSPRKRTRRLVQWTFCNCQALIPKQLEKSPKAASSAIASQSFSFLRLPNYWNAEMLHKCKSAAKKVPQDQWLLAQTDLSTENSCQCNKLTVWIDKRETPTTLSCLELRISQPSWEAWALDKECHQTTSRQA